MSLKFVEVLRNSGKTISHTLKNCDTFVLTGDNFMYEVWMSFQIELIHSQIQIKWSSLLALLFQEIQSSLNKQITRVCTSEYSVLNKKNLRYAVEIFSKL